MKKILFPLILLFFSIIVNAQTIRGMIPVGFNASQIDGDEIAGYHKFGVNAGAGALVFIDVQNNFEAGFEMLYNQVGSKSSDVEFLASGLDRHLKFDYISVPLYVNYIHKGGGYLGLGAAVNYTLSEEWIDNEVVLDVPNFTFKTVDLTGIAQAGFHFNDNFRVGIRFNYSIIPMGIGIVDHLRAPRNNYVSIRLETILYGLFK